MHAESNVTKEGIEVKANQVWKDLDTRQDGRLVRIISVNNGVALVARCDPQGQFVTQRATKLSVRRMHKGSTGWGLHTEAL